MPVPCLKPDCRGVLRFFFTTNIRGIMKHVSSFSDIYIRFHTHPRNVLSMPIRNQAYALPLGALTRHPKHMRQGLK